MKAEDLKALQKPIKEAYQADPQQAAETLHASGTVDLNNLTCTVNAPGARNDQVIAGLHRKAGGDGTAACSGEMLLQSLVACSGVTLAAVATAMNLSVQNATVEAEGVMDFRGTLGVDRGTPVGLTSITLIFRIESDEPAESLDKLTKLTERYCVVLQTLARTADLSCRRSPIESEL